MQKQTFNITGMSCAACARRIHKALIIQQGVLQVSVNVLKNTAQVSFDPQHVNVQDIMRIIEQLGYGATCAVNIWKNQAQNQSKSLTTDAFYSQQAVMGNGQFQNTVCKAQFQTSTGSAQSPNCEQSTSTQQANNTLHQKHVSAQQSYQPQDTQAFQPQDPKALQPQDIAKIQQCSQKSNQESIASKDSLVTQTSLAGEDCLARQENATGEDCLTRQENVASEERLAPQHSAAKSPSAIHDGQTEHKQNVSDNAMPAQEQMAEATNTKLDMQAQEQIDAQTVALKQQKYRLCLSMLLSLMLCYLGMGSMWHWPLPASLSGLAHILPNALVQMCLCGGVLYLNRHYFISGFYALKCLAPNMDSLLSLGSGAATVFSLYHTYLLALTCNEQLHQFLLLSQGQAILTLPDSNSLQHLAHTLYFESAAMILTLISLGKYFEAKAKGKTSQALAKLMALAPQQATILKQGQEHVVPIEQVQVGDLVVVKAGEQIPVDGIVVSGYGLVDESTLTGESLPCEKLPNSQVTGATFNTDGHFVMRTERVGADSTLAQIIAIVDEATSSQAPIARIADRISGIFVPVVIGLAALTLVVWLLCGASLAFALTCAIAVLVISCPCALGLATPTAIMVGTGQAANHGILFKSANIMERAGQIDTVVLDKTGTLTTGQMQLTRVYCLKPSDCLQSHQEFLDEEKHQQANLGDKEKASAHKPNASTQANIQLSAENNQEHSDGFNLASDINQVLSDNFTLATDQPHVRCDTSALAQQQAWSLLCQVAALEQHSAHPLAKGIVKTYQAMQARGDVLQANNEVVQTSEDIGQANNEVVQTSEDIGQANNEVVQTSGDMGQNISTTPLQEPHAHSSLQQYSISNFKNLTGLGLMGYCHTLADNSSCHIAVGNLKLVHYLQCAEQDLNNADNDKILSFYAQHKFDEQAFAQNILSSELNLLLKNLSLQGHTVLFCLKDRQLAGLFVLTDTLKEQSCLAVKLLGKLNVDVMLLTGDQQTTAQYIAQQANILKVHAQVLPQEKSAIIQQLQAQGKKVAMVGDGINDAPALAQADVGFAIGAGSDIAIESADVVLVKNELTDVVAAMQLSRAVVKNIKENLFWAFAYNAICIPIAAGVFFTLLGWSLNPMLAAAAMSLSSISVVSNALRLRYFKPNFNLLAATQNSSTPSNKTHQDTQDLPSATNNLLPQVNTASQLNADCNTSNLTQVNTLACQDEHDISSWHKPILAVCLNHVITRSAVMTTHHLKIEGMSCQHCVKAVTKALQAIEGVEEVQVELNGGIATIQTSTQVSEDALRQAIENADFKLIAIN